MAKEQINYECQSCGAKSLKWSGRCGHCGEWDTVAEEAKKIENPRGWVESSSKPEPLEQIDLNQEEERWATGVEEFDRVIGGGVSKFSVGLLGGNPGVGKSTLILQLLARLVGIGKKVLYVSGEESANQIYVRSERLKLKKEGIVIVIEANLENLFIHMEKVKPDFVVIDSIQTLFTTKFTASAGSVTQVRECAAFLLQYAKRGNATVMFIGHVTKEGDIAGPRILEHMVDYVLYLEGEKDHYRRVLRSVKNRFGPINEVGLFKMTPGGLAEVKNPNAYFAEQFSERQPGVSIFPAMEGTRSLLLEIQALVGESSQNFPVRTPVGMDRNKLQMIVAVLQKHLPVDFNRADIYLNLAGGFKMADPAMDLAVVAALLSSYYNRSLPPQCIFFGELSLTGEIRPAPYLEDRLKEATRCHFEKAVIPKAAEKNIKNKKDVLQITPVQFVGDLLQFFT